MAKELVFANREAAFEVAKLLLEECYVVMLSREDAFYILNFEYSEYCDRNDVVFMSREDFEDRYFKKAEEDAIEALQAEVERLKDSNEELREKQTFIDHYETKWMTSAKDVPTAAYEHGYADGRDEAMAKMKVQE